MDVYGCFIHNCKNLEATKMSFSSKYINTLWPMPIVEYYLMLKGNELSKHEGNLHAYFSVKEATLKGYILCYSYQDILEKAKLYKQ